MRHPYLRIRAALGATLAVAWYPPQVPSTRGRWD